MNENTQLSAYVRYFTWWNLVRLTKLFANLSASFFPEDNSICLEVFCISSSNAFPIIVVEVRENNLVLPFGDIIECYLTEEVAQ